MSQRSHSETPVHPDSPAHSAALADSNGRPLRVEDRARPRWLSYAICLFLAVAVWAVFGQTLRSEFINYDDDLYIYENSTITGGLNLREIVWVFTHDDGLDGWYPVTAVSHMLDWQLYGANAGGHHLTNVLLQAATAILLFLVLRKMTGRIGCSAFVAAVFAIHPLRVESVAWVTERKDVLSGLFFTLALWMWLRHLKRQLNARGAITAGDPRRWTADYYLALIFFALGLLSKAMLVTLPFILLLLDYWPLDRFPVGGAFRSRFRACLDLILEKVPFLLVSAAACAVTMLTQKEVVSAAQGLTIPWRVGNALLAYADYIWHMIYPVGLALIYPHPEKVLPVGEVVGSALVLLFISVGVVAARRKHPYLLVGWLWYLVMLLPVIGVMQAGDQTRADRYTYLPQIGLYIMIAWGAVELCAAGRQRRAVLGTAAAVTLVVLAVDAHDQTSHWKDSITLWTSTLARTPHSPVVHCNLGIALALDGKQAEAVQHFNRALKLNPDDAKTINNLGKVLTSQGKLPEAIQYFDRALQINPADAKVLNNLGVALAAQGKLTEAEEHYERALQLKPNYTDAHYNLGNALAAQGQLDEAIEAYAQTLALNPDFAAAHCNLGLVLARQGKVDAAVEQYQLALQLKPDYADALNNLGSAMAAQGKLDVAAQYYERSLQLQPDDADALNNLGVALARSGKVDEAIQHFTRVLELHPDDASAHNNLGIALAGQGKVDEAVQHFQRALILAQEKNDTALADSVLTRLKRYQPDLLQQ